MCQKAKADKWMKERLSMDSELIKQGEQKVRGGIQVVRMCPHVDNKRVTIPHVKSAVSLGHCFCAPSKAQGLGGHTMYFDIS